MDKHKMRGILALWVVMSAGCMRTDFLHPVGGAGQPDSGAGIKTDTLLKLDDGTVTLVAPEMTCAEINGSAATSWAQTLEAAEAEHPCQTVDDCVLMLRGVSCAPSCPSYVSIAARKIFDDHRVLLQDGLCTRYARKGCPSVIAPPCVLPIPPNACAQGKCVYTNEGCINGACTGVCTPGSRQCLNNGVQTCGSNGTWGAVSGCGTQICERGTCVANTCAGTPGEWSGCRGSGCAVCSEKLLGYPNYFKNHPGCIKNDTCAGFFYTCNAACPAPGSADR